MSGLTGKIILQSLGQVGSTLASLILLIAVVEILLWLILGKVLKSRHTLPFMLIAPAAIGLALLVIYPIGYEVRLAFSNMSLRSFKNPEFGLDQAWRNFRMIFTQPVLKQAMFFPLFLRTILWTAIQVTSHVVFGMCLALLLHRPMKLRGLYQALIIVPWAIPQVIAVLTWRNEFHFEYGFINIKFQLGPVKEFGKNGTTIEDVITALITRLEGFQKGPFKCEENDRALAHLDAAKEALEERTAKRKARGVEGKYLP